MAENSKIEWTDATWNPITGCTMVSAGCTNCYAMGLAAGRLRHHPSRAGLTRITGGRPVWTGEVRLNEDWLAKPLRWRRPRRIFVCAHGDLFHEAVPDDWIDRVFAVMALAPRHTFQVLTKRPERMRAYRAENRVTLIMAAAEAEIDRLGWDSWPASSRAWEAHIDGFPNVWLGTSIEDQATADARIPHLLATPAAVRFVSAEPLLGPVDLRNVRRYNPRGEPWIDALRGLVTRGQYLARSPGECSFATSTQVIPPELPRLDWLIAGGESGPGARPMHPDWARSMRDQCQAAGVPFFMKQMAKKAPIPDDLLVREWPP
jgi:protein gp37